MRELDRRRPNRVIDAKSLPVVCVGILLICSIQDLKLAAAASSSDSRQKRTHATPHATQPRSPPPRPFKVNGTAPAAPLPRRIPEPEPHVIFISKSVRSAVLSYKQRGSVRIKGPAWLLTRGWRGGRKNNNNTNKCVLHS